MYAELINCQRSFREKKKEKLSGRVNCHYSLDHASSAVLQAHSAGIKIEDIDTAASFKCLGGGTPCLYMALHTHVIKQTSRFLNLTARKKKRFVSNTCACFYVGKY